MNRILMRIGLSIALAFSVAPPAALAKHNPAHKAAVRQCKDEYKAAERQARMFRGPERKIRMNEAKRAFRQCKAAAPR